MEEPPEIKNIPLKVLSQQTLKILGMQLNVRSETLMPCCGKVPDYRGLAELLNKSFDFIRGLEEKRDPTAELLKSLKGQDATLSRLWSCLCELGRTDILERCRDMFIQDTRQWQNRKPRDRFEAEELRNERKRNDIKKFLEDPNADLKPRPVAHPTQEPKRLHASKSPPLSLEHKCSPSANSASKRSPPPSLEPKHSPHPSLEPNRSSTQCLESKRSPQLNTEPKRSPSNIEPKPTDANREKKGSKIRAFFTQKIKSLPHSKANSRTQPVAGAQTEAVLYARDQSSEYRRPPNGQSHYGGTGESLNRNMTGNHTQTLDGDSSVPSSSENRSVRSAFSSLSGVVSSCPTVSSEEGGSFSSHSAPTDNALSCNIVNGSALHDIRSGDSGSEKFRSNPPEPLLTTEDDIGHRAMFDAYVNCAPEDILQAKEMLRILEAEPFNLHLFLELRQLLPGGSKYEDIAGVVEERCHGKVVIILTRHYLNSEGCHFVTHFARALDPAAKKKQIIPIEYENIDLPRMLKGMHIISKQRDEKRGWFWQKLTEAIRQL